MLNYIQSFGLNNTSVNNGSSSWNNGHATLARVDVYGWHAYFNYSGSDGNIRIFRGDGGYDSQDWAVFDFYHANNHCLLYTSPSPRDVEESRMPSSA